MGVWHKLKRENVVPNSCRLFSQLKEYLKLFYVLEQKSGFGINDDGMINLSDENWDDLIKVWMFGCLSVSVACRCLSPLERNPCREN